MEHNVKKQSGKTPILNHTLKLITGSVIIKYKCNCCKYDNKNAK